MAAEESTPKLLVRRREAAGSRAARRLRRAGRVPGVLYGGDAGPVCFEVDARELRMALAHSSALLDLSVDGGRPTPVVVKEAQRHPVRSDTVHVDLLRVRLDQPIHATVTLELVGSEEAAGVKAGGVLEHVTREVNIEALPTDIPESITHDVSAMEIGESIMLSAVTPPEGVTILDDPEAIVVATLSPPRLQAEEEPEIEAETGVVGEEAEGEEPQATEGATSGEE